MDFLKNAFLEVKKKKKNKKKKKKKKKQYFNKSFLNDFHVVGDLAISKL